MANPSAIWHNAAHTTDKPPSSSWTRTIPKTPIATINIEEFSWKKGRREKASRQKKGSKSYSSRQKNRSREWPTARLASSTKLQNLLTSHLYSLISIGFRSAAGFNAKYLSPASTLSLVQLLHTSLSCFISILLLLFVQPQILGFSVSQVCAGGLLGRNPFSTSDLSSGTLSLSLSGP